MKKKMKRIIDFLDSFFYYPKMKRYFINKGFLSYNPWQNEKFATDKICVVALSPWKIEKLNLTAQQIWLLCNKSKWRLLLFCKGGLFLYVC